jgi:osmoprotectant transport system substrate-binding protein
MRRWVVLAAVLIAGACAGADPSAQPQLSVERHDGIVVASFDFAESRLLAEIYAQALEAEGYPVVRQLGLGPRELVMPALRQGFVDVVPEYTGSALDAIANGSPPSRPGRHAAADDIVADLRDAVRPHGLDVLAPSPASNQNELVVTGATADTHRLAAITDLGPVAPTLTIGGPPECPVRQHCLIGLADIYGLRFDSFVPLAGEELVRRALEDGVIDVGVLFSTDATLAAPTELVVLADDLGLQPADHVVPMVRRAALDTRAVAALDEVSNNLSTDNLRFLNWRLANAGTDVAAEARGWLRRHGFVDG